MKDTVYNFGSDTSLILTSDETPADCTIWGKSFGVSCIGESRKLLFAIDSLLNKFPLHNVNIDRIHNKAYLSLPVSCPFHDYPSTGSAYFKVNYNTITKGHYSPNLSVFLTQAGEVLTICKIDNKLILGTEPVDLSKILVFLSMTETDERFDYIKPNIDSAIKPLENWEPLITKEMSQEMLSCKSGIQSIRYQYLTPESEDKFLHIHHYNVFGLYFTRVSGIYRYPDKESTPMVLVSTKPINHGEVYRSITSSWLKSDSADSIAMIKKMLTGRRGKI